MEKLKPDEPEVINAEDIIYEPEIINDDDYEPDTDEEFIQNQYKLKNIFRCKGNPNNVYITV